MWRRSKRLIRLLLVAARASQFVRNSRHGSEYGPCGGSGHPAGRWARPRREDCRSAEQAAFKSPSDMDQRVPDIGAKTMEHLRPYVRFPSDPVVDVLGADRAWGDVLKIGRRASWVRPGCRLVICRWSWPSRPSHWRSRDARSAITSSERSRLGLGLALPLCSAEMFATVCFRGTSLRPGRS